MGSDDLSSISAIDTSRATRSASSLAQTAAPPATSAGAGQAPQQTAPPQRSGDAVSLSAEAHEAGGGHPLEDGTQVASLVGSLREQSASSRAAGSAHGTQQHSAASAVHSSASGQPGQPAAHNAASKAPGAASQQQGAAAAAEAKKVAQAQEQRKRDQETLARAIAAEARGEGYEAQVGVASTIVNHAKAKGRSIHSLVHSSFLSSSSDGNSVFYRMPTSRIPNFDQMLKAAGEALEGRQPITSQHMYFTDRRVKSTPWTDPSGVISIGNMRFYKERPQ